MLFSKIHYPQYLLVLRSRQSTIDFVYIIGQYILLHFMRHTQVIRQHTLQRQIIIKKTHDTESIGKIILHNPVQFHTILTCSYNNNSFKIMSFSTVHL